MEQLNRVEIIGTVGTARIINAGDRKVARLSVATNYAYKNAQNEATIETTWHNVTAWESQDRNDLEGLSKGMKVRVLGRIRNQKYTGADGIERYCVEIMAKELTVLPDEVLNMETNL